MYKIGDLTNFLKTKESDEKKINTIRFQIYYTSFNRKNSVCINSKKSKRATFPFTFCYVYLMLFMYFLYSDIDTSMEGKYKLAANIQLQSLVEWARHIPHFNGLSIDDQVSLSCKRIFKGPSMQK